MKCLICQAPLELSPSQLYARCPACHSLFMNVAGSWQHYPVDRAEQESIERSLGFPDAADKTVE